ncbi:MAG: hypothetical protein J1F32_00965 [Erysipelotrichales bacterium]|nr:hypothetical protein [Erysipelotrichales bacterium]
MDLGNLVLFWFLGALVLMILNFIFFRFAFIRKLVYAVCSVGLVAVGFSLKEEIIKNGGELTSYRNNNIETLTTFSVILLLFVILMSFGDSLMDFSEETGYSVSGFELFGTYFFSISEETIEIADFFTYYAIATVGALAIWLICFVWFHWFAIFGILGCVALGFLFVLKPLLFRFAAS